MNADTRDDDRPDPLPIRTQTFPMGRPAVDLTKALRVSADLEDDALAAPLRRDA